MADLLATPSDLASVLKRGFDEYDTASVILALEVCTAVVQAAADGQRIVLVADDEEEVWGGEGSDIRLSQHPIKSIASVSYAGSPLVQGTTSGTWRRTARGIWRDLGWADLAPVTVVYTHGYDPNGPSRDKQKLQLGRGTTLSLAKGLFINPDGSTRKQIDDYAVSYDKASAALEASPFLTRLIRRQYGPKARMVSV